MSRFQSINIVGNAQSEPSFPDIRVLQPHSMPREIRPQPVFTVAKDCASISMGR
jgi:hypothetical protein